MKWAEPILKDHEIKTAAEQEDISNAEPHMLHVVYLTQLTRGRPWWEKKIIEQLQLEGPVRTEFLTQCSNYVVAKWLLQV